MAEHSDSEADFDFAVGSLPDGRVLLDFFGMTVDHLKLNQDMALDLAESLVEAVKMAKQGLIITTERRLDG